MTVSDVTLYECGGHHHPGARSVSWNRQGNWLAMGGPSPRIWSFEANGSRCSEVLVISGHTASVDRVRFHPRDDTSLATSGMDGTVRVWDTRSGVERAVGRIDVSSGKSATYIDWCGGSGDSSATSYLAVTERDGSVHVFDARKLSSVPANNNNNAGNNSRGRTTTSTSTKSTPLHTFQIPQVDMDACIFSPNGQHLVAATAPKGEMLSDLRIWNWKEGREKFDQAIADKKQFTCPAHTGPIFSLAFSPDGTRLGTGSSDSIVGIWGTDTMCCAVTLARRTKFIRSVAWSHDSQVIANANEEDGIELASGKSGDVVGLVQLRENPSMGVFGGADEVAFNPSASGGNQYVLACARAPLGHMSMANQSAAVVIRCRISANS